VLLKTDARFLRGARGIGIEGVKKVPNLKPRLLIAWLDRFTWLDVIMHF
jgi:hypothetical protein